eukprot:35343-Rhodomonas_salina.1
MALPLPEDEISSRHILHYFRFFDKSQTGTLRCATRLRGPEPCPVLAWCIARRTQHKVLRTRGTDAAYGPASGEELGNALNSLGLTEGEKAV